MPRHISIVFPGQGSQSTSMLDLIPETVINKYKDIVFNTLEFDLIDIVKNGTFEELSKTSITQPAILLISFLLYKHISQELRFSPNLMCGHSLGEYSALVASNSLDLTDALKIVHKRGIFMENCKSGSMCAVLNVESNIIKDICNIASLETRSLVTIANLNTPNQTVIAGDNQAVDFAIKIFKERGYKKCIKLKVSVASHCELMLSASKKLSKLLNKTNFNKPNIDVIHNLDGVQSKDINELRAKLINQLVKPVQWIKIMNHIKSYNGVIIECGPGKVLSGLAKGNDILNNVFSVSDASFFDNMKKIL